MTTNLLNPSVRHMCFIYKGVTGGTCCLLERCKWTGQKPASQVSSPQQERVPERRCFLSPPGWHGWERGVRYTPHWPHTPYQQEQTGWQNQWSVETWTAELFEKLLTQPSSALIKGKYLHGPRPTPFTPTGRCQSSHIYHNCFLNFRAETLHYKTSRGLGVIIRAT